MSSSSACSADARRRLMTSLQDSLLVKDIHMLDNATAEVHMAACQLPRSQATPGSLMVIVAIIGQLLDIRLKSSATCR